MLRGEDISGLRNRSCIWPYAGFLVAPYYWKQSQWTAVKSNSVYGTQTSSISSKKVQLQCFIKQFFLEIH